MTKCLKMQTKSGHSSNTTNWGLVNVPVFHHRQIRRSSWFPNISLKNMAGKVFFFSLFFYYHPEEQKAQTYSKSK